MFEQAPFPENESRRRKAVERTGLTEKVNADLYEVYCHLARQITGCPQSWATVVHDVVNQNFVADFEGETRESMADKRVGERAKSFCQYAILSPQPLIVNDMRKSKIFRDHPSVVQKINPILFYAAFPIVSAEGYILGSLCVRDHRVRRLSADAVRLMRSLAAKLSHQLDLEAAQRAQSAERLLEMLVRIRSHLHDAGLDDALALLKAFAGQALAMDDRERLKRRGLIDDDGALSADGRTLMLDAGLEAPVINRLAPPSADADGLARLFEGID